MAEYMLREKLGAKSIWDVSSAGTSAISGMPASSPAIEALSEIGIDLSRHESREFTAALAKKADVIVTMTRGHRDQLLRRFPEIKGKVFLLKELGTAPVAGDIEDPIGMSVEEYCRIRDEIAAELPDVMVYLHQTGGL